MCCFRQVTRSRTSQGEARIPASSQHSGTAALPHEAFQHGAQTWSQGQGGGRGGVQPPWEKVGQSPGPAACWGVETPMQTTLGTVSTWFLSNSSMACVTPSR